MIEQIFQMIEDALLRALLTTVVKQVFTERGVGPPPEAAAVADRLTGTVLPLTDGELHDRVLAARQTAVRESTLAEAAVLYLRRKRLALYTG